MKKSLFDRFPSFSDSCPTIMFTYWSRTVYVCRLDGLGTVSGRGIHFVDVTDPIRFDPMPPCSKRRNIPEISVRCTDGIRPNFLLKTGYRKNKHYILILLIAYHHFTYCIFLKICVPIRSTKIIPSCLVRCQQGKSSSRAFRIYTVLPVTPSGSKVM